MLPAGAVGGFGPILAVALLLSGRSVVHTLVVLLLFAIVAVAVFVLAWRPRSARFGRLLGHTLATSEQLGVRVAIFLAAMMTWAAGRLGLDVLLGSFAPGWRRGSSAPARTSGPRKGRWRGSRASASAS